jgi:AAHS family 4-hydroxybenzoate transporter-like MFS transporter
MAPTKRSARSGLARRVVGVGVRCGVRGSDLGPVWQASPFDCVGPSNRSRGIVVGVCAGFIAVDGPTIRHRDWVRCGAPNAVTIMSELCPDSRRATLTNLMSCDFPLGTALGGFFSAWLIPHSGWQIVFLVGGAAQLVLSPVLYRALPESLRYMLAKGYTAEKIKTKLAGTAASPANRQTLASITDRQTGLKVVLSPTYIVGSLMLWTAFFMGLIIFYGSVNWMPVLLRGAGLDSERATLVSTLFPLGGIGAVLSGIFMDSFVAARVIAICYALTAVSVYFIGQTVGNIERLVMVVFMAES